MGCAARALLLSKPLPMHGEPAIPPGQSGGESSSFHTTHWTIVLQAAGPGADGATDSFAQLYLNYWKPLYAHVRRRGHSAPEAEDITQDFFRSLIEKQRLAGLERAGGKFRSFLLTSLNHFLANHWDRAQAQKRGGGVRWLSLNAEEGESGVSLEAADHETPESLFERQWVSTLLANVLERLRLECEAGGKGPLFADLRLRLQGDTQGPAYAEVAVRHNLSEGAVKVAVHRLRQRYGEMLRKEIARTVGGAEEVEEELRYLAAVASR